MRRLIEQLFACSLRFQWCHKLGWWINHQRRCVICGRSFPARLDLPDDQPLVRPAPVGFTKSDSAEVVNVG